MTEKKNEIAVAKNISEAVLAKVQMMQETGGLVLPEDYHAGNALNAAYLKFKQLEDKNHKPAEQVCSKESVALALMDMVIQGLSPAKNQCYFVVHGNKLTLMRSYMGTVAAAKRFGGVKSVHAQVVYKNDDFGFEIDPNTGTKRVTLHRQSLESIEEGTIRAAYAVVITKGQRRPSSTGHARSSSTLRRMQTRSRTHTTEQRRTTTSETSSSMPKRKS